MREGEKGSRIRRHVGPRPHRGLREQRRRQEAIELRVRV